MITELQLILRQRQIAEQVALLAEHRRLLTELNRVMVGLGTLKGWTGQCLSVLPSVPPLLVRSSGLAS